MYACLHQPDSATADPAGLAELARNFSPEIERTGERTVVFSISGLSRLIGNANQIAAEIARRGAERGLTAHLAIAANPDAAILAARRLPGVTLIPRGRETEWLGRIRLDQLPLEAPLRETLERWGIGDLAELAELPPIGLAERLGERGVRLYNLAHGRCERPLQLEPPATRYSEQLELEEPAANLEPLLFLLARLLNELCRRLQAHSRATNRVAVELALEGGGTHRRILELPVPQTAGGGLLKLLRLDLEAHPPAAPVTGICIRFNPVRPRSRQGGLFTPPAPEPDKLQFTLARLEHLAGEGNAGSPVLLDTHRPGAFRITRFAPPAAAADPPPPAGPRVTLRFYRPPLTARVRLRERSPRQVIARGVSGNVLEAAGPWRTSGDWWRAQTWTRDEWDLALTDGGIYRVFCQLRSRDWFVEGIYD